MFNTELFIKNLCALGNRQGEAETKALELITSYLQDASIHFSLQKFKTFLPEYSKALLLVDGKKIAATPSCFIGGKITDKNSIISSLFSSQNNLYQPNINFNPQCQEISKSNHYFAPAFSIQSKDVGKVISSKRIFGTITVKQTPHTSTNILVGNSTNPKTILFCHYDSIESGACDNASGTAVLLKLCIENSDLLDKNLFVFAGNEELSYDQPIYWGHGYRAFEKTYGNILKSCKHVVVIDSVGLGNTIESKDPKFLHLGFPLQNISTYAKKTSMITGDYESLMTVYHSSLDTPQKLNDKEIQKAYSLIKRKLAE